MMIFFIQQKEILSNYQTCVWDLQKQSITEQRGSHISDIKLNAVSKNGS